MSRRDLISYLLSILAHGAFVYLLLGVDLGVPDDFEFALPEAIEFGIYEEMEAAEEELAELSPEEEHANDSSSTSGTSDAQDDAKEGEAEKEPPKPEPKQEKQEERPPPKPARIPPGSQIALRVDMAAVRASRLEGAARDLIRKIPDWHLIAGGSGIDPIDGLDRLMIATPDPRRRDLIILAGKSVEGRETIRAATFAIAASQDKETEFSVKEGVEVAQWHSIDPTERVLAIVGPKHFTISPPEALRVLRAMIHHRENAVDEEELEAAQGADALLSLGKGEAISIEVENIPSYTRRLPCEIPQRGRASVRELPAGVSASILAHYRNRAEAREAKGCWEATRDRYTRHFLIRLLGFDAVLNAATINQRGARLSVEIEMNDGQTRQVLATIGNQIARMSGYRPPPRPRTRPASMDAAGESAEATDEKDAAPLEIEEARKDQKTDAPAPARASEQDRDSPGALERPESN